MKDRIGAFGDVVFGLLLTGIVASFSTIVVRAIKENGAVDAHLSILSLLQISIFDLLVVIFLWSLQARVISELFVDHFLFIIGYMSMLYWLFSWVLIEAVIPSLEGVKNVAQIDLQFALMPAGLISASFISLAIIAAGGLAFSWFPFAKFQRYERLRDIVVIVAGAFVVGTSASLNLSDLRFPILFSIVPIAIVVRIIISFTLDQWALDKWGSTEEKSERKRMELAGYVLLVLLAISSLLTTLLFSYFRGHFAFYVFPISGLLIAVWFIRKTRCDYNILNNIK